jgi:hypothetical protein
LSQVAVLAAAIAAELGCFSFWWTVIPAFFAGSFQISNGPGFDLVLTANRDGRFSVFPIMLMTNILPWLAVAGIAYWITSAMGLT